MGPDSQRRLPPSLLSQRIRTIAVLLAPALVLGLTLLLALEGASAVRPDPHDDRTGAGGSAGGPSPSGGGGPFTVSYAGAASRLADLTAGEKREQLRDWLRTALAAHLKLDIARYRPAVHDAVPVREKGLADITRQPTGPGRALFDGRDRLHLLLPADDPHASRTIGLLLDRHRADHGSDPRTVQVHRYTVESRTQTIRVGADEPRASARFRAAHGYVAMRVDRPGGLREFLKRTRHLSRLERRGEEIWAGGWKWRTGSAPPLTMADVTAIQRGYLEDPVQVPGFSLDPPKGERADPVRALRQGRMYHQARYEGGLKGTEVGATLFYTDLIAKSWINGTGTGVPDKAVKGFVPDPDAVIPAAHCPAEGEPVSESGRLWFGQNMSGFLFTPDRVEIGARATRLFTRTSAGGGEIEPSYGFGRGLRWWDRHFQEIADYEPQYARLEQIMRWSGALEWLSTRPGSPGLPRLDDREVRADLRFEDWYERHSELRERGGFTFVGSARRETVITRPSKVHEYCGRRVVRGGVSLADAVHRMGGQDWRPGSVPGPARRAGLYDPSSRLDPATGEGRIRQVWLDEHGAVADRVERRFSTGKNGASVVETAAAGRRSGSFGKLKVWRAPDADRTLRVERTAKGGVITESIALEGREWGRLEAVAASGRVLLRWIRGPLERVRLALQSAQDGGEAPARADVLYRYQDAYKVGGPDAPWLRITEDGAAAGGDLAFRLGRPRPGGAPVFSLGTLVAGPRGPPGGWLEFRAGSPDGPSVAVPGHPPGDARSMRVETADGRKAEIRWDGERVWARAGDPVAGLNGTAPAAALLRDFDRVAGALREAEQAGDGRYRAVRSGADGTALVGADKTIVVPAGHPFGARVREALGRDPARSRPLIGIESGHAVHHGRARIVPGAHWETMDLADLAGHDNVLVSDRMRSLVLHDGALIGTWMKHDRKVSVVEAKLEIDPRVESATVLADAYRQQLGPTQTVTWIRVTGPGGRPAGLGSRLLPPGPAPTPSPTPSPTLTPSVPDVPDVPDGPGSSIVVVPVLLACLHEDVPDPACAP